MSPMAFKLEVATFHGCVVIGVLRLSDPDQIERSGNGAINVDFVDLVIQGSSVQNVHEVAEKTVRRAHGHAMRGSVMEIEVK